jgi:hypothetical protein
VLEFQLHFFAQLQIERSEWLVQQEDTRPVHQGSGQGHALLLSTGELPRIPLLHTAQADQVECFANSTGDFVARNALHT